MPDSKPRPSVLPAWSRCAAYDPKEEAGPAAQRGTIQHKCFEKIFKGAPDAKDLSMLDAAEAEGVIWASEYVKSWCENISAPIESEVPLTYTRAGEWEPTFEGTADLICSSNLFDLKTGEPHEYEYQMAAYALMMFQRNPELQFVLVHLLYSKVRSAVKWQISRIEAEKMVESVLKCRADPERRASPCDYCKWCANADTCPALSERALTVGAGRPDWALQQYHTSEITKPEEMSKALDLARALAAWCEGVEHRARKMIDEGAVIPKYGLSKRAGNRSIKDAKQALELAITQDMHPTAFASCCTVKVGELEKLMGKKQFAEVMAPVLTRAQDIWMLTREKEEKPKEPEPLPALSTEEAW